MIVLQTLAISIQIYYCAFIILLQLLYMESQHKRLSGFQKRKRKQARALENVMKSEVSATYTSQQQITGTAASKKSTTKLIVGKTRRSSRGGKAPPPLRAGGKLASC